MPTATEEKRCDLRWWEEAGLEILRTSNHSNDIRLVSTFNLFEDRTTASKILSSRDHKSVISHRTLSGKVQAAPTWDGKGILSAMSSLTAPGIVAEELDRICSTFHGFSLEILIRHILRYDEPAISSYLDGVSNSRDNLAQHYKSAGSPTAWEAVQEALRDRHPLAYWLVSTSRFVYERPLSPLDAMISILEPIQELLANPAEGLIPTLKRLSVLAARFEDFDWRRPFPTDFSLLQDINSHSPQDLATSFTRRDIECFEKLPACDIVDPQHPFLQDIGTTWDKLRNDVRACFIADSSLSEALSKIIIRLIALRNYHSGTAILAGVRDGGAHPEELRSFWPLLDLSDNYAIYRAVDSKQPGIPFLPPLIEEMIRKGSSLSMPGLSQHIPRLREGREVFIKEGITAVIEHLQSAQMGHMRAPIGSNANVNANMQPSPCSATSHRAMPTPLPPRPEGQYVFQTVTYKSIGDTTISVDIYKPNSRCGSQTPIMLYIHGGGWVGGNRIDCSQLLLRRFLQGGFVICSMDYRLLPESSFDEMQEDVRDIEPWLRQELQAEMAEDVSIDGAKIVVVGASAGALLALLTPKLWVEPPSVIISMYGPTSLQKMPFLSRGRFSSLKLPPCTDTLLSSAIDFAHPPTEQPLPTSEGCCNNPRAIIFRALYMEGKLLNLLLRGVERGADGKLALPINAAISPEEAKNISPLDLCQVVRYPPLFQMIGEKDEFFDTYHVTELHAALTKQGIQSKAVILPGEEHGFDTRAKEGGIVDKTLSDAVRWAAEFVFQIVEENCLAK